ncbi:ABC transporter permease [Streptomyces sp. SID2888]|uniref:ABC transporter permease n=1 Tax=Streptomyces sp. SID2888 TaxID=2690256 RepID=UPI001370D5F8|nr:ABC transporter permease [Streptomyces sp. SID2888]MYV46087.1 FtsX-like permease family protein [Streptomyces sp. SID2888]
MRHRPSALRPARLSAGDVLALGVLRLRSSPTRAVLSALGICIGVATMIVVVGIPASSRQALADEMAKLGTNILKVQSSSQQNALPLPEQADSMVARIGPVTDTVEIGSLRETTVRRTAEVDPGATSGVSVIAVRGDFEGTLGASASVGRLPARQGNLPSVVLGSTAAHNLGITNLAPQDPVGGASQQGIGPQLLIGGEWFTVTGILRPLPLLPELDSAALVSWEPAKQLLGFPGNPDIVYLRADEDALDDVRAVVPATVSPQRPSDVTVSRPSDALAAKRMTDVAFSSLFLGLAGVALIVGGVGVANTMIISVLERRTEIGLRRALGAGRGHIRIQFLTESMVLCLFGGATGVVVGAGGVAAWSGAQGWPTVLPVLAVLGGLGAAVFVGAVAGLYPASRAAALTPTQALASS